MQQQDTQEAVHLATQDIHIHLHITLDTSMFIHLLITIAEERLLLHQQDLQ